MATDNKVIPGIVTNGVVVPQIGNGLAEGMHVDIVLREDAMTPEVKDELAAWQRAGMKSWAMIEDWESTQN